MRLDLGTVHARYPNVNFDVSAGEGDVAKVLAAHGEHARLVVIGARHGAHHTPLPAGPGHTVAKLLAHCSAPVARKLPTWSLVSFPDASAGDAIGFT